MIKSYSIDGESVDKTIVRLISETEGPRKMDTSFTNINLNDDTFENLKQYKLYDTEPHMNTLYRLLSQVQQK